MRRHWWITAAIMLMIAAAVCVPLTMNSSMPGGLPAMTSSGLVLLEDEAGLYVLGIIDGSRADSAGIQPGDRLSASSDMMLTTIDQFEALLAAQHAGDTIPLTLDRHGQTINVDVILP